MNRSAAMIPLGAGLYEVVPFGWLFVPWAAVSVLPMVLFSLVYLSLVEGLRHGGRLVVVNWSRLKSALRDKKKE